MKYGIFDWAGNRCFSAESFETFEDAWGFLYQRYDALPEKDFDDQMSEYFVEEVRS